MSCREPQEKAGGPLAHTWGQVQSKINDLFCPMECVALSRRKDTRMRFKILDEAPGG